MRISLIVRYISFVLLINAAFMIIAAGVSFANGIDSDFFPLLLSAFITFTVGVFPFIFVPKNPNLNNRETHFFVIFAWLTSCIFGMLPYVLWGGEFSIANAWFESVSGYTTTGASILTDVENVPHGLLFWRSSTHYIGGVGVVMFALLVLQSQRVTRMRLTNAEVSQLAKDNFRFKAQQMLRVILTVYIGLTIILTFILMLCGMNLFDAVNHAFSTIATGGFSTKNASISSFDSVSIGIVLIIFMLISGMHFGMIYAAATKRSTALFKSPIIHLYLLTVVIGTIFITANLMITGEYTNLFSALYHAGFQVAANISTTGFAVANTSVWPIFSICILIYFAIQCACAGSTTGGIKTDRVYILIKSVVAQIKMRMHPNAVISVRARNHKIDDNAISSAMTYIILYLFIIFCATAILSLFNIDLFNSFTVSLAFLGNVGLAFGEYGSLSNFSTLPDLVKFTYPVLMLLGRLEIYGLFLVFIRSKYQ